MPAQPTSRSATSGRQITVDPTTGRLMLDGQLLDRRDPRLWGSVGRNVLEAAQLGEGGSLGAEAYDPRYYEAYTVAGSEGDGGKTAYRLRPEIAARLGGRTQFMESGVGGDGEIIDPSQLTWDDEFGILSPRENIKDKETSLWGTYGPWLMMAGAGAGIGLEAAGALGASEGATAAGLEGLEVGGAGAGLTPEAYAGLGGDFAGGVGTTAASASPVEFGAGGLGPEEMGLANFEAGAGIPGASSGGLDGLVQWAQANPMQAARLGFSAAQLIAGAAGAASGGRSGGGTSLSSTSPLRNPPTSGAPGPRAAPAGPASNSLTDYANEQFGRYRTTFQPLEDLIVSEATNAGSPGMQEERASLAGEDVAQQFDREKGILGRNLQRSGVNPNSAQGQALAGELSIGEGGAKALAMNEARRAERDSGFARRLSAAGLGSGVATRGLSALGTGEGMNARDRDLTESSRRFDVTSGFDRERAAADDEYRRAMLERALVADDRAARSRRNPNIGSAIEGAGRLWNSGLGTAVTSAFGWADGGPVDVDGLEALDLDHGGDVEGPGTGTSDSILARVSDGEFVLPVESVKLLDKLSPGILDRVRKLGLHIRKMGESMERGETLEGEFSMMED